MNLLMLTLKVHKPRMALNGFPRSFLKKEDTIVQENKWYVTEIF
jgi:hypothetical protein